jgi:hypothetical protein
MTLFQLEARKGRLQEWCNHSRQSRAKIAKIGIITGLINIRKVNINPAGSVDSVLANDPFYNSTIAPKLA